MPAALNVFPVTITDPAGTVTQTCRLVVDGERVAVWAWPHRAPAAHRLVDTDADRLVQEGDHWRLDALSGTYTIAPQQGCGCGHPLKFWSPRPHAVST